MLYNHLLVLSLERAYLHGSVLKTPNQLLYLHPNQQQLVCQH